MHFKEESLTSPIAGVVGISSARPLCGQYGITDDVDGVFSRDLVRGKDGIAVSRAYVCFHHSDIRAL